MIVLSWDIQKAQSLIWVGPVTGIHGVSHDPVLQVPHLAVGGSEIHPSFLRVLFSIPQRLWQAHIDVPSEESLFTLP